MSAETTSLAAQEAQILEEARKTTGLLKSDLHAALKALCKHAIPDPPVHLQAQWLLYYWRQFLDHLRLELSKQTINGSLVPGNTAARVIGIGDYALANLRRGRRPSRQLHPVQVSPRRVLYDAQALLETLSQPLDTREYHGPLAEPFLTYLRSKGISV